MGRRSVRSFLVTAIAGAVLAGGSGAQLHAQQDFFPYWGKNRVKYDRFDWHIYETDHFEIYYYPELEEHLERIAGYAESAYQEVSARLRHDLAFVVPLIVFKTHSEFEQQNVFPGASPEGVGAFAEPSRNRIVLPIDEGPDGLYRLITHELTHIFEFDIIPRGIIRQGVPLWVDEGLADFMAGVWRPLDIMQVRDVAVSDTVPSMTRFERYGGFASGRVVYNLGHAVFEFIESRWGDDGIRRFMFGLRRSSVGGGGDPYEEVFDLEAEEFDDEFKKYLDDRFEPFKEKESPTDYGRNLAPDPLRSRYPLLISIEASPSGEVIAAVALNRKNRELDIVLVSAQSGEVIRNLTEEFDQDLGFQYIATLGLRFNTVPWLAWAPDGDHLAYFVRKNKYKSLVIQNIVTREIEQIIDLDMVDEPESPDFSPDGRSVVFSALTRAVGDIYRIDLATQEVTNLTEDALADYAPVYSPDGNSLLHLKRISGNNKLYRLDLATGEQTQLTFGTHDEGGAQFIDERTIVFSSTAVDPSDPIEPEVARDGEIFNVWTLDLENGELRQYTDTSTGNVNPVLIAPEEDGEPDRFAFITYYKSEYGLHTVEREEPIFTAVTSDFGTGGGPVIDFQAPLTHTLIGENARQKGAFENMFLEGRPPLNVGMTSNGDFLGGTQITFADVLGDQQFSLLAYSVMQYRTLGVSYANLAGRMQFAVQGFSQQSFFYGYAPGYAFNPGLGFLSRDDAIAVRSIDGGSMFVIYPFDRFRRVELSAGLFRYREQFDNEALQAQSNAFQQANFGDVLFRDGAFMPLGINFIQETTVFREFGPIAGNTFRAAYEYAPSFGGFLSRQSLDLDGRYYLRIAETGVLAMRARGFRSWGQYPDFFYFGGNSDMRGYDYLEFIGHKTFFANAELRFPLVEAMATPIGILGGIRGSFFFDFGMAGFNNQSLTAWDRDPGLVRPIVGYTINPDTGQYAEVFGPAAAVSGFRLVNARASYGISLATLAIGIPIHFDWSWRTLFNKEWEDIVFASTGGSEDFRRVRFTLWIGYDF
ncbi:MAG: DPP IV N-terminal domain-containing protein [Acidobacteria bacterium]|nr:DPP IV N-terminal domain-containing protein [Acidobacteriota bacterium]